MIQTVCGQQWLNCYLDTLREKEQKTVIPDIEFKFGNRKNVSSGICVSITCRIFGKNVTGETDVMKSEIPKQNNIKKQIWKLISPIILHVLLHVLLA